MVRLSQRAAGCLVLLGVALAGVVRAQPLGPAPAARVDSVFERYSSTTPGCALLVRRNGGVSYERAYGLASLDLRVPVTAGTVFNLASASKEFTAASVLLLAQAGKLSLDDDVRKYVPEAPDLGGPVTIRELLTHTSGWRDYIQLLVWQGHEVRDHVTARDAMNVLGRQRALNFAPGTAFAYSNTGYLLLALVVQRVSGETLGAFARERIFDPLGMRHTRYVADPREIVTDLATAYEPAPGGGWREAPSGWELLGDGGVYSTVEDLARWDDNFTSGAVGGLALGDSMGTRQRLRDGATVPYGLGLFVDEYAGRRRVWHNGIWAGYRSIFMRFPDVPATIIALCNAADADMERLADAVANIVLPRVPASAAAAGPAPGPVPDGGALAGLYYSGATNQRVRIVADSGRVALAGPPALPLISMGRRRFRLPGATSVVEFQPDSGDAQTMLAHNDGRTSTYHRVEPPLPPQDFGQYAGRYRSDELGVEWTVLADSGRLVLRDERGSDTPIEPIFRDGFDGPGTVRFERDATGAVTALTMTTRGVRALRFARLQ